MEKTYVIVGAGVFGASTALELRRKFPGSKVILLDKTPFPCPSAASFDVNKIIRADYPDVLYTELALEAQKWWREGPLFKPFYHESGMLSAENDGESKVVIANFEAINHQHESETFSVEEGQRRFDGAFRKAKWDGVTNNYFNPRSGWGDGAALQALIQAAVDHGAEYRAAPVSRLSLTKDGTCRGVWLESGEELAADQVILAAGAWTPWLLAESAPDSKELHAGDRLVAAGAIQCRATFKPEEAEKLKSAPVFVNPLEHTKGESIPPTSDGYLKFNYEGSFTNMTLHEASRELISVPPKDVSKTSWGQDVPNVLRGAIDRVVKHIYGSWIDGLSVESYRMCWDSITPNQDWIIARHPHCANLSIAAGGSFHTWKFMPLLGRFVVQMLEGTLEKDRASRWAWDRNHSGGAHPDLIPEMDLHSLH